MTSDLYRRTYDAYVLTDELCKKAKDNRCAPMHYHDVAHRILMLDPVYAQWFSEFQEKNNLNPIQTQVVIECVVRRLYDARQECGSSGEKDIGEYLSDRKVIFVQEKTFANLRHVGALRFDFYIQSHNIVIEYHGKQHFEPVEYFGGEESYKSLVVRDEIKRQWCANNGVKLIEIRFDEDIASVLNKHGL